MESEPKGPEAARLRQRKFALLRQFQLPQDLLPGSLSVSHTRCGKPTCHCAQGEGHPAWSLTFMAAGKKRVERIPKTGWTMSADVWKPAAPFRTLCARSSPPMPSCWCCGENSN